MSDRYVFAVAGIFVVIAVIIAKIQSLPPAANAKCKEPNDTVMIAITKKGFEPQNSTVHHCDQVIFANHDVHVHHPSFGKSGHPIDYPTFTEGDIKPQKAISFIAEKVGVNTFYDALQPKYTGELNIQY